MKDIYKATCGKDEILDTRTGIARQLGISRQAVHQAIDTGNLCKGYTVEFHHVQKVKTYNSQSERLSLAESLLQRSKIIIDEMNIELAKQGDYTNVGLVDDIARFLEGRS